MLVEQRALASGQIETPGDRSPVVEERAKRASRNHLGHTQGRSRIPFHSRGISPVSVSGRCLNSPMTATTSTALAELDSPSDVLVFARESQVATNRAQANLLTAAVTWAEQHPPESIAEASTWIEAAGDTGLPLAGEGAPLVAEFCIAEFALAIGRSTDAGRAVIAAAVELKYRLPAAGPGSRPVTSRPGAPAGSPRPPSGSALTRRRSSMPRWRRSRTASGSPRSSGWSPRPSPGSCPTKPPPTPQRPPTDGTSPSSTSRSPSTAPARSTASSTSPTPSTSTPPWPREPRS